MILPGGTKVIGTFAITTVFPVAIFHGTPLVSLAIVITGVLVVTPIIIGCQVGLDTRVQDIFKFAGLAGVVILDLTTIVGKRERRRVRVGMPPGKAGIAESYCERIDNCIGKKHIYHSDIT